MHSAQTFEFLNFIDDMGIQLVCRPLRYIERLAEFLCDVVDVVLDADVRGRHY